MLDSPQSPSYNTTRSNIRVRRAHLLHMWELIAEMGVAPNSFHPKKVLLPLATALVGVIVVGETELCHMRPAFHSGSFLAPR